MICRYTTVHYRRSTATTAPRGIAAALPVVSLGVVELGQNEAQEQLLIRADKMLYNSKAAGRNIISG